MFVERVYGTGRHATTVYLTRVKLTPSTRWGGLYLHMFHRGDADRDPHDHPWDFWTFPLTTYWEEILSPDGVLYANSVEAGRWHHRPARHIHRLLGRHFSIETGHEGVRRNPEPGLVVTLVWHGPWKRGWGFWPVNEARANMTAGIASVYDPRASPFVRGRRVFVAWRKYLGYDRG